MLALVIGRAVVEVKAPTWTGAFITMMGVEAMVTADSGATV